MKADDLAQVVIAGERVQIGNFMTMQVIGDGVSFEVDSTAPGGDGPIILHWSDAELFSKVLLAVLNAGKELPKKGGKTIG